MALIGTAFISTARTDRCGRRGQHIAQRPGGHGGAESAVNIVVSEFRPTCSGPRAAVQSLAKRSLTARRAAKGDTAGPFENWDGLGDALIAPRVPVLLNTSERRPSSRCTPIRPTAALFSYDPKGVNPPLWAGLSAACPACPVNLNAAVAQRPRLLPGGAAKMCSADRRGRTSGRPLWPRLQVVRRTVTRGTPTVSKPGGSTRSPPPTPTATASPTRSCGSFRSAR